MPLEKGFLQPKLENGLSKIKIWIGLFVGLLVSISLYAIQYMTRETLRFFSFTVDDILVLTDAEVNFYNLIFAFIAVIVGQSFCFLYWFDVPLNKFNLRAGRVRTIVNDQRLSWNFISWFFRVTSMYAFLFITPGLSDYYLMSFYPSYNYFFILIIIFLFLQTWNGLLLTFKKKAFKWMFLSVLVISVLSFGLSKINIIDYKSLNDSVTRKKIENKYHLRLPEVSFYEEGRGYEYISKIKISLVKSKKGENKTLLFLDNELCEWDEIPYKISSIKQKLPHGLENVIFAFLKIDEDVSMKEVNKVLKFLAFDSIQYLRFVVVPEKRDYPRGYYIKKARTTIPTTNRYYFYKFHYDKREQKVFSNEVKISLLKNRCRVNDSIVNQEDLSEFIKIRILQDSNYVIRLDYKTDIKFKNYFSTFSSVYSAINELRLNKSLELYGVTPGVLEEENRGDDLRSLKEAYPFAYEELVDTLKLYGTLESLSPLR